MFANVLWAIGMFVIAVVFFVFFVEFARHTITSRDHDDRLFGGAIAMTAFGGTLIFAAWGLAALGV